MTVLSAEDALSRTKVRLRQHSPFFAVLTLFARYRFDERVAVAETDGREVTLNGAAFLALADDARVGLLLHVTLHAALQHPSRMRGREPQLWNIACDVMVNHILRGQTPFPPPPGTYEGRDLDRKLIPETAEAVYEWLQRHRDAAQRLRNGGSSMEARPSGTLGREKPDKTSAQPDLAQSLRRNSMASALSARFGNNKVAPDAAAASALAPAPAETASESPRARAEALRDLKPQHDRTQQELLQQHWNAALIRAREHDEVRRQGTDPAAWSRELKAASEPEIDWRTLLARFVIRTPTDFAGFDRRFLHSGLYIETLEQETVSIAVAVDTSGSIADEELDRIAAELRAIVSVYPHIECSLYYCDAAAHGPYELASRTPLPAATGGGGTSFEPFFARLDEMRRTQMTRLPGAAIYFTDGFGTFPEKPPEIPTMWVALPGAAPSDAFPFGEVIRMNTP